MKIFIAMWNTACRLLADIHMNLSTDKTGTHMEKYSELHSNGLKRQIIATYLYRLLHAKCSIVF